MSSYRIELVGLPNKLGGARRLEVDLVGDVILAELTSALRRMSPELEGFLIQPGEERLAGRYTFNVNCRFHMDEYDVVVHPSDRILILTLAMGG
jgi:hypothetical protein